MLSKHTFFHVPDKNFQLVRYDGWCSNKMRGQRNKQAATEERAGELPGDGIEIIGTNIECRRS